MTTQSLRALAMAMLAFMSISFVQAQGPWTMGTETTFLRLHTSVGTGEDNVFGYDPGQRVSLSRLGANNLGARINYFQYNHEGTDVAVGNINLDTYNLDFETFKRIDLTSMTSVEMSGGVRYNETEYSYDGDANDFTGYGGVLGIKANACVGTGGTVYARGKYALIMGNGGHDSNTVPLPKAYDVNRQQTELGFGYEHPFSIGSAILTVRGGTEWQNWQGFGVDPGNSHPDTDFGLGGFLIGATLNF